MAVTKNLSATMTVAMLFTVFFAVQVPASETTTHRTIPADLTAAELIGRMTVGWNLGNTFDAITGGVAGSSLNTDLSALETTWIGTSNLTTQSLIRRVRAQGFDTLRIPITWNKVADPNNNYAVRADWMA